MILNNLQNWLTMKINKKFKFLKINMNDNKDNLINLNQSLYN